MAFMPYVPVEAPVPRGDRYGLVRVANGPVIMPEKAQEGGVTFRPVSCGETRDYPIVCQPDESLAESPEDLFKVFDLDDALIQADPFLVYSTIQCGTVGRTAAEMEARLRLRFANGEPTGVERGFYRALMASGAPEVSPVDPTDIVSVLSTLEQYIYGIRDVATPSGTVEGVGYNHIAYIHATPGIAAIAGAEHLVVDGPGPNPIKYTPMGSIWVFGGGYSGALPGGVPELATEAIWVTGQVSLWQAATVGIPPQYQTLDRVANQWMALAEREWIAAYECGVAVAAFEHGGSL